MRKKTDKAKVKPAPAKESITSKDLAVKYTIGIISLLCAIILVYRGRYETQPILSVGEIAPQKIDAQTDFSYPDKPATKALEEQEVQSVPAIYYLDPSIKEDALKKVDELFSAITQKEESGNIKQKIEWLDSDVAVKTLLQTQNLEQAKQNTIKLCAEILDKGLITSSMKIKIISSGKDMVSLRNPATQNVTEINVDKFIVDDELDSILAARIKGMHPFDRPLRQAIQEILLKVIKPNLVYDSKEVERQRDVAKQKVEPIYVNVKKGQTIIRQGDPVTETHRIMLEAQAGELNKTITGFSQWRYLFGTALLMGILFFIMVTYLHYHQPEIFSCNKRLFLLSVIIISTILLTRLLIYIPINESKPIWQYFMLVPISAMLIAIMMDKELAIISSMIMSVLATVIAKQSLPYTVVVLFGSIVALQTTTGVLHRWEFIKAGVLIGIANMLAIVMLNLLKLYSQELLPWKIIGYQAIGGFISGLSCAVLVSICLPLLEQVFNITTDIRLLELSDLNHPLLKMMITEAPGTYHHSIVVSNMAEDAAAAIGANSLLAKVGGYFHDIGKITKPEYFAENAWFEEESRHEKLLPTMSNIVISAHVKDGTQLAQKYRLPEAVVDIISEHHGTSLVYFFYKQAEKVLSKEGTSLSEADFRYPGPKPHTKESGIILLADAIEAASKTLVKPSPNKIEELVKDISNEKISDGQLDECGLTLKDINIIRERFTHIMTGILHRRVEYPDKNED